MDVPQTSVLLTDGPVTDVVAQEFEHIYRVGASPYAVDDYRKVPFVHGPRNWQHARATIAEKFPGAAVGQFLSERLPPPWVASVCDEQANSAFSLHR